MRCARRALPAARSHSPEALNKLSERVSCSGAAMPKYIDEPELELKRKFAAELLANPTQAWLIATRRFPDDMARRYVVLSWIKDTVVLQIQRELRIRAEQAPLPSARRAYELLADETASVRCAYGEYPYHCAVFLRHWSLSSSRWHPSWPHRRAVAHRSSQNEF